MSMATRLARTPYESANRVIQVEATCVLEYELIVGQFIDAIGYAYGSIMGARRARPHCDPLAFAKVAQVSGCVSEKSAAAVNLIM